MTRKHEIEIEREVNYAMGQAIEQGYIAEYPSQSDIEENWHEICDWMDCEKWEDEDFEYARNFAIQEYV